MIDKVIVDTNVLLYAYDRGEPAKQPRAVAVLDQLVGRGMAVLTPHV